MRGISSQQSLLLRKQLTTQMIIFLVAFTIAFAALAALANITIVPWISDEVVDATATKVRFDPVDYIKSRSIDELLASYAKRLQMDGREVVAIDLSDQPDDPLDTGSDQADAAKVDSEDGKIASTKSDQKVRVQAADDYKTVIGEALVVDPVDSDDGQREEHREELTLQMLGFYAAWLDYADLASSGHWDFWYEGAYVDDPYSAFVARDLSVYETVKSMKLPIAIALYMLGCLVIVIVQMRRSLGYFDELSNAVAGILADRSKPIELSSHLSVAQNELNRIRAESIADEYAAKAAEQRKNELVAYLAHDIRTPLTSILGYLSILDESPDLPDESRMRFTHITLEKAERLESLIDEFFEITRYNLQSIPIERANVDVRLFMEQIADEFLPTASEKGLGISVDIEAKSEDEAFFVDAGKLARAVENVLRNAVAYADEGSTVNLVASHSSTWPEGESGDLQFAGAGTWKISVTNHGREISPEHLESIFEKFYREDGSRNAQSGGAGLGLAIAKEIIAAHGGSISAVSKSGVTTFEIII